MAGYCELGGGGVVMVPKEALAVCALDIRTVHDVCEPVHAPLHPAKEYPEAGVAVSTTVVFAARSSEQSVGHAIPVPEILPPPETAAVSVYVVGGGGATWVKFAVTVRFRLIVSTHVGVVPEQLPPQ
jgi:hypothetical protein